MVVVESLAALQSPSLGDFTVHMWKVKKKANKNIMIMNVCSNWHRHCEGSAKYCVFDGGSPATPYKGELGEIAGVPFGKKIIM